MTSEQYLQQNPVVAAFISKVDAAREVWYTSGPFNPMYWGENKKHLKLKVTVGSKFIKLVTDGSVWGFIARNDGELGGVPYKRGDLLKAATFRTPAKHSRGNIIDGTDSWDVYGPNYLRK
jgi:hypothetical protein